MGEGLREGIDVAVPRGVVKGLRLNVGERSERSRQRLSGRHLGVVHEHGNDDRPVREGRFDLQPHHVLVGAVQQAPTARSSAVAAQWGPMMARTTSDSCTRRIVSLLHSTPAAMSRVSKKTSSGPKRSFSASAS